MTKGPQYTYIYTHTHSTLKLKRSYISPVEVREEIAADWVSEDLEWLGGLELESRECSKAAVDARHDRQPLDLVAH